jgi:WD40 repeat protein
MPLESSSEEWQAMSKDPALAHHTMLVLEAGYAPFRFGQSVVGLAVSPDGSRIFSASHDRTIKCWSWPDGKIVYRLPTPEGIPGGLAITADGSTLISVFGDTMVRLRSTKDGQLLRSLTGRTTHHSLPTPLALTSTGDKVAANFIDSTVRIWTVPEGNLVQTLPADQTDAWGLAVTPDGSQLIVGVDYLLKVFHLADGKLAKQTVIDKGISLGTPCLTLSKTGTMLAATELVLGIDGVQLRSYPDLKALRHLPHAANAITLHPANAVITGGRDGQIKCWRADSGEVIATLNAAIRGPHEIGTPRPEEQTPAVTSLALSQDGKTLFSGTNKGYVIAWDLKTRSIIGFLNDNRYDVVIDRNLEGLTVTR